MTRGVFMKSLPKTAGRNRRETFVQGLLFAILLAAYAYIFPRWADWSQNSRLNLTLAIVDDGSLRIDRFGDNTGDYALFEGHRYSDKAPGPSFLAVPVYAAARPILQSAVVQGIFQRLANSSALGPTLAAEGTGLLTEKIYYFVVLYLCTLAISAVPAALLGVMFYRFLRRLGVSVAWSAVIVLIYGLATSAFPYSGAFFSHQLTASLLFGAFLLAFEIKNGWRSPRWSLVVGLMLAWSVISEYPTALIAGAVFLYAVWALADKRWVAALTLAGLPPGLLLMAYDWAIFRTPWPVGYEYSALYQDVHSQGLISLTYPHFDALWGITFGAMRGLFYVSPVLLLAAAGFWLWWRQRQYRAEWLVCLWATLSFILYNGSSVMWQGGFSIGPRYLVPMLPFLSMGLQAYARQWGARRWARGLILGLGLWSLFVVWALTLGGQNYPDWSLVPLFEYTLPRLIANDIARNLGMVLNLRGWASLLPLLALLTLLGVVLANHLRSDNAGRWDAALAMARRPDNEMAED